MTTTHEKRNWPMRPTLPEIAAVCFVTEFAESILLPVWLYQAGHAIWIPVAWIVHIEPLTVGIYCLVARPLTVRTAKFLCQICSSPFPKKEKPSTERIVTQ